MPSILVVDDEPDVRTLLRDCFELDAYSVSEANNATTALETLAAEHIDLVTLDLNLGGDDGLALAREITAKYGTPIIMVTGKGDMIDRVVGLELGADDYITKPFHLREVLARVRSVLRRTEARDLSDITTVAEPTPVEPAERFAFGPWILCLATRELVRENGTKQELTTAEFNLLKVFVERPQRVLSRDTIMDLLKGHDWSPMDRSIDTLVARLRKKIDVPDCDVKLVKTVRGVGYSLATAVRRI